MSLKKDIKDPKLNKRTLHRCPSLEEYGIRPEQVGGVSSQTDFSETAGHVTKKYGSRWAVLLIVLVAGIAVFGILTVQFFCKDRKLSSESVVSSLSESAVVSVPDEADVSDTSVAAEPEPSEEDISVAAVSESSEENIFVAAVSGSS